MAYKQNDLQKFGGRQNGKGYHYLGSSMTYTGNYGSRPDDFRVQRIQFRKKYNRNYYLKRIFQNLLNLLRSYYQFLPKRNRLNLLMNTA